MLTSDVPEFFQHALLSRVLCQSNQLLQVLALLFGTSGSHASTEFGVFHQELERFKLHHGTWLIAYASQQVVSENDIEFWILCMIFAAGL